MRTGSLSRAAEQLDCTPSALTQTANILEEKPDRCLPERNRSGTALTPAGHWKCRPDVSLEPQIGGYDLAEQLEEGRLDPAVPAEAVRGDCT